MKNVIKLALLTSVTLLATSTIVDAKERKRGAKSPEKAFERLDSDASEAISFDEFTVKLTDKAQKHLDKLDTDLSGTISLTEYLAGKRHSVDLSADASEIVQCVQDTKDATPGSLIKVPSVDKFAAPESKFDDIDSDANDELDLDEINAAQLAHATSKFNEIDGDLSADITLVEFTAYFDIKKETKQAVKACINEVVDESAPI